MTCEELLILRENYKFKVKLADTSKILRKLLDKQLLISDGIGRGMKYYINKDFNATVGKPLETVGKPLEQEIVILDYLKENNKITTSEVKRLLNLKDSRSVEILRKMVDKRLINKLGSCKNTYYEENK